MIDREWITAHIPHQGSMCLLDRVTAWSETDITCHTSSHRSEQNPLRLNGELGIAHAIEYAAQAMAIHGALLAQTGQRPAAGYLASVREVNWSRQRLDDIESELEVTASRLSGNDTTVMYQFEIRANNQPLATGRASVILDATK